MGRSDLAPGRVNLASRVKALEVAGFARQDEHMEREADPDSSPMQFSFHVDCGEAWTGHQLTATGLRLDGVSDDAIHADYSEHHAGGPIHPMTSLTYRVTPALHRSDLAGREVDAEIRLDPPADPNHWPSVMSVGGERDNTPGSEVTDGAFGPFVLPAGTRHIAISLENISVVTGGIPPRDSSPDRYLGELLIDVSSGAARWAAP
jgi:hypothetical protein